MSNINIDKNLRKEIVSREMLNKFDLFRIVKNKNNEIFVDSTYTAHGRGAYIKKQKESINIAKSKNLLSRELKTKVNLNIYDELLGLISE